MKLGIALLCMTAEAVAAANLPQTANAPQTANSLPALEDRAALESFFDGTMQVGMDEHHVTGAVVAIVKDGQVLFIKGYGHSNLARNTPIDPATSLFRIGSTTKTLTWTAVMQLVEQGKLDLDKDVNSYLKGLRIPDTYPRPVTLRHLMTHTAGFEEGYLGYLVQTDPKRLVPIAEALRKHMPERVRPAGEMSAYSNYGAALAGLIVEQVSGMPYAEYIEKNIFEPLDMRYATVREPLPERLAAYATTGYKFENGGEVPQPFELVGGFAPAGSGSVSALDMTHFMIAHLQDGRYGDHQILRPETARLMHATAFSPDPRFPGMALGFYHMDLNGMDAFGHGGDTYFQHTEMALVPSQHLGLFLSCITEDRRVVDKVEQAFLDRYFPRGAPTAKRLPDDQARAQAAKYAGSYQWTRRNHSAIEKVANLLEGISVAALPNGNLVVGGLDPDPLQFEPIGSDLYREVLHGNLKISFRSNASGAVTHMFVSILPFMPTQRTPWYELGLFWFTLLGIATLIFLSTLASTYYRWREIRTRPPEERRALWIGAATAGWAIATVAVIVAVAATTGLEAMAAHIPTALTIALVMPIVFIALSAAVWVCTLRAWRAGYWTIGRRVGYSLIALAALVFCTFFWQWNLLGWHYG